MDFMDDVPKRTRKPREDSAAILKQILQQLKYILATLHKIESNLESR